MNSITQSKTEGKEACVCMWIADRVVLVGYENEMTHRNDLIWHFYMSNYYDEEENKKTNNKTTRLKSTE